MLIMQILAERLRSEITENVSLFLMPKRRKLVLAPFTLVGIGLSITQLQAPFGITLVILLAKGPGRIQGMTVEKMVMMISFHLNNKYV